MKKLKSKYRWVSNDNGQGVPVHTVIAEKVLGKKMPKGAEIHHVDGNGHNNAHENLVVCPSDAYHKLLHVRTKALEACGNADWLKCVRCGKYDAPENLYLYIPKDQSSPRGEHRKCHAAHSLKSYYKQKEA